MNRRCCVVLVIATLTGLTTLHAAAESPIVRRLDRPQEQSRAEQSRAEQSRDRQEAERLNSHRNIAEINRAPADSPLPYGRGAAQDGRGDVDLVRIRPAALIRAGEVARVRDVLVLDGLAADWVAPVADQPIERNQDAMSGVITHEQIAARLAELGVNRAAVNLVGPAECRLRFQRERAATSRLAAAASINSADADNAVASDADSNANPGRTLADAIRNAAARDLAKLGGQIEIDFERGVADLLDLSEPTWEFNVQPLNGRGALGLRDFRVGIRRDGKLNRTVTISGRVRLTKPVAIARRPLNLGILLKAEDIELKPQTVESLEALGVTEPGQLIGRQLKRFISAGEQVRTADLKTVDVVQRSRPVTVLSGADGVALRLTGVALDNGGMGDQVRVRLGDSRKAQREVRGVVTGLATVRVEE